MYKLLSIGASVATRNLELENLDTATIDVCFDDSAVTSFKNFDFMKINESYNCKIYLFGELDDSGEKFKYIKDVTVGRKVLSEVINGKGDLYYVNKISASECLSKQKMLSYKYTRKDLVQVNNIVHSDFEQRFLNTKLGVVMEELDLFKKQAITNLQGEDKKYMTARLENLEEVIPKSLISKQDILYVF